MWLSASRLSSDARDFLDAVGRAVALAQNFEQNTRYTLGIADLGRVASEGPVEDWDEFWRLSGSLQRRMLGTLVRTPHRLEQMSERALAILRAGAEARNYVAHESAVAVEHDRPSRLVERVNRLRLAVEALAKADNLASAWSYEIQEKAPAPGGIVGSYPSDITEWVLAPVAHMLQATPKEPP